MYELDFLFSLNEQGKFSLDWVFQRADHYFSLLNRQQGQKYWSTRCLKSIFPHEAAVFILYH